jgi:hypothetical protein
LRVNVASVTYFPPTEAVRHEREISNAGRKKLDFSEIDQGKPVLLRLSLAGNLVKPLLSLYGTEWRERGYGLREKDQQPGKEGQERRMELCRWEGGWKLEGEDVASETEDRCRSCVDHLQYCVFISRRGHQM